MKTVKALGNYLELACIVALGVSAGCFWFSLRPDLRLRNLSIWLFVISVALGILSFVFTRISKDPAAEEGISKDPAAEEEVQPSETDKKSKCDTCKRADEGDWYMCSLCGVDYSQYVSNEKHE